MMSPVLSRRIGKVSNVSLFVHMPTKQWVAFLERADEAGTFDKLQQKDKALLLQAEAMAKKASVVEIEAAGGLHERSN